MTVHLSCLITSLPEYDSFLFENDQGGLTSVVISDNSNEPLLELPEFESFHFDSAFPRPPPEPPDVEICLHFEPDAPVIDNFNKLNVKDDDSFTLSFGNGTDKTKITRKPSKAGKHEHHESKAQQKPKGSKSRAEKSTMDKLQSRESQKTLVNRSQP
ncbi:hypothetical protein Tco_1563112 [Tanacetum coccineum]